MIAKLFEDEKSNKFVTTMGFGVAHFADSCSNRHAFQKILAAHNIGGEAPMFSFSTGSRKFNEELCLDPLLKQRD